MVIYSQSVLEALQEQKLQFDALQERHNLML